MTASLAPAAPQMTLRIVPRQRKAKVTEIAIQTLDQASAIVDRLRLEKGWRSSTMPKCLILVDGKERGYVSLNGRVWEGAHADQFLPGKPLVFDPQVAL